MLYVLQRLDDLRKETFKIAALSLLPPPTKINFFHFLALAALKAAPHIPADTRGLITNATNNTTTVVVPGSKAGDAGRTKDQEMQH